MSDVGGYGRIPGNGEGKRLKIATVTHRVKPDIVPSPDRRTEHDPGVAEPVDQGEWNYHESLDPVDTVHHAYHVVIANRIAPCGRYH
jgi:hypothetical protein